MSDGPTTPPPPGPPPGPPGGPPPPGPPPAGGQPPAGGVPTGTASLGQRIGARLLDYIIVGIPGAIVLGLTGLFRGFFGGMILSALWFGYFAFMESNRGATVGKSILNLNVVTDDGSLPSLEQAAKRNIWMLAGLVPFVGGLLALAAVIVIIVTISNNAYNRGYHDEFAGTAVMR